MTSIRVLLLTLAALGSGGCVGTLVKDLAQDQATLRIRINNAVYGTLEIDRSNVQGGMATSTKDGLIVDTSGKIPPVGPAVETRGAVTVTPGLRIAPTK